MALPHSQSINSVVSKPYVDESMQRDFVIKYNEQELLKFNPDEVTITISGETHQIKDDQDFITSFNYVIGEITGFKNYNELMERLREDARQEILAEIGVTGQRLLKSEKLLNTKKVKK